MKSYRLIPSYWSLDAIIKYPEYRDRSRFSEEEAMLKDCEFSRGMLNLKACRATKVGSQFKVQEQSLG